MLGHFSNTLLLLLLYVLFGVYKPYVRYRMGQYESLAPHPLSHHGRKRALLPRMISSYFACHPFFSSRTVNSSAQSSHASAPFHAAKSSKNMSSFICVAGGSFS